MEIQDKATRAAREVEVSGLVRRVRRLAKFSQRQLAHELGVSQSAVAKWETGRTTPSARMLARVLQVVELALAAVKTTGEVVLPMKVPVARDAANRRYPAHTFVWPEGWWAPVGSEMTAYYDQILFRSEDLELPRVRYSRWWQAARPPTRADLTDHPTWPELVAEAREAWLPTRRNVLSIPAWAFKDSRQSRNRRPEEFEAIARTSSFANIRRRAPTDGHG